MGCIYWLMIGEPSGVTGTKLIVAMHANAWLEIYSYLLPHPVECDLIVADDEPHARIKSTNTADRRRAN
jgi:hypothetical protein